MNNGVKIVLKLELVESQRRKWLPKAGFYSLLKFDPKDQNFAILISNTY